MRCTSKKFRVLSVVLLCISLLCGCGKTQDLENAFQSYDVAAEYNIGSGTGTHQITSFSQNLAVTGTDNISNASVDDSLSEAACLFSLSDGKVLFAKNIYEQLYPASTTKILTAYLVLKYCDLDDTLTISNNALNLEYGSSTCGFNVGDTVTVKDALYGMMLRSGNEAAIALAEHVSGSVDAFAELMNQEATALGATNSHFTNSNGLTDENHYTTVYDLYLIFNAALQNEDFYNIVTATDYTANYTDASGTAVTQDWSTTNGYLSGTYDTPDGVTVLGGKTGTTTAAGSCLVLLSESNGKKYISIVLASQSHDILYKQMSQLLSAEVN